MKLQFKRQGRQFFFVTIAIEGRAKALSRLLDEKSRPQLLPHGETVKAALLSLPGFSPARRSPISSSCRTTSTSC